MSTTGWVFMVGLRVVDLAAMVGWLVWFFRLRDSTDDGRWEDDEGEGGSGPKDTPLAPEGPGGDGLLPDSDVWPVRLRDHSAPARRQVVRRAPRRRRRRVRAA